MMDLGIVLAVEVNRLSDTAFQKEISSASSYIEPSCVSPSSGHRKGDLEN
jgi:hypothetical protein